MIILSKTNVPLGVYFTCKLVGSSFDWGTNTSFTVNECLSLTSSHSISRHLARLKPLIGLYPSNVLHRTEVDHWLSLASGPLGCSDSLSLLLNQLDKALVSVTYITANCLTVADLELFACLYKNHDWHEQLQNKTSAPHIQRWYNTILNQVQSFINDLPDSEKSALKSVAKRDVPKTKREDGGKFVDLPGAEMGKVVVRFPPEASGYLHIGHAKAALLNQHYQKAFKGQLIMRFDDTNPDKEKVEYEEVILEDLKLLEIEPDRFTYTSDHFEKILSLCEMMIGKGLAYCDNTDPETMKKEREERKESKNRNNSCEFNLKIWTEMKNATDYSQSWCVRAKIDMNSANGCMRDPTIYRCKNEPHVRTGTKYKVYPTYDFACPIVDSLEGVTHALRTTEYHDRDDQYFWFLDQMELRRLHIYEYSRLVMNNTVLSKRKLTWFVNEGLVDGWDDPRFPTVRGILRRGMTVEGLKEFIIAQGSSRSVVNMEWDKIWSFNKKVIDQEAPRYTALQGSLVPVKVSGVEDCPKTAQKHPKDPSKGTKTYWISGTIYIETVDAAELKEGENATFINWGNLMINKIIKDGDVIQEIRAEPNLSNTDYKKTLKLTWLAETPQALWTPVVCVYFDHILNKSVLGKDEDFKQFIGHKTRYETKMVGDDELKSLKAGDIIQIQRKGFFKVDEAFKPFSGATCRESPIILFYVPDGHTKDANISINVKKVAATGLSEKEKEQSSKGKAVEKSPQEEKKQISVGSSSPTAIEVHSSIKEQGDKIRKLKSDKVDKNIIMSEVDILKLLKSEFKNKTNLDWTPDIDISKLQVVETVKSSSGCVDVHDKIKLQGDKIRNLKSQKADKQTIKDEVSVLLKLKEEFKNITNVDWTPDIDINSVSNSTTEPAPELPTNTSDIEAIHNKIKSQGDKVRTLKADKAEKDAIKNEINQLLKLKKEFSDLASVEWKPDIDIKSVISKGSAQPALIQKPDLDDSTQNDQRNGLQIHEKIKAQGDKIRSLKSSKAEKDIIKAEVEVLLKLKTDFKNATSLEWKPDIDISSFPSKESNTSSASTSTSLATASVASSKTKTEVAVQEKDKPSAKKQTRLGLEAKKEDNLADWYSQVITKSELIEYYSVSGCYILRPWSFSIWETIQSFFDKEIKKRGVENAYFPIFVSKDALEKEKAHIADFSPEVAWVTRSGSTEMAEPVAIRPTSETVMYPAFAKWVQSHRDLPIRINQWSNVVRWEFKQPTPFLRTREFLWQEGHSAFATEEEAIDEVHDILGLYARVYEELLAIPVIRGRKTEKEKFPGGSLTLTTEAFVSANGRGIQGATSHHLGQNFSKMFDIIFEDPVTNDKKYVYQNSWGLTTRTIGVLVMVHGDNKGLILPPKVAPIQVIILPVGITAKTTDVEKDSLTKSCEELKDELVANDIIARCDLKDNVTPAWKFNKWELKGVPIRLELGPREVAANKVFAVRRDNGEKQSLSRDDISSQITKLFEEIHINLFNRALADVEARKALVWQWTDFLTNLDKRNLIVAPFCGDQSCEERIKKDSTRSEPTEVGGPSMGAKGLCIPLVQPEEELGSKCVYPECLKTPLYFCLFGRSY